MSDNPLDRPPYVLPAFRPGIRPSADRLNQITEAINRPATGVQQPYQVLPDILTPSANLEPIILELDGEGTILTSTVPATAAKCVLITVPCTITKWTIWADQADTFSIDIWRANGAVPTSAGDIVGSGNAPALSGAAFASAAPSGWTSLALKPGDLIGFGLVGTPSAATTATVALTVRC